MTQSNPLLEATEQTLKARDKTVLKALDYAFDKAINGIGPLDSASKLAKDYISKHKSSDAAASALVQWQMVKAASSGFVSGLGGLITIPVTLPANIVSVSFVQIRMAAAISQIYGYDPKDDQVRTLVYASLCGNAAGEAIKGVLKEVTTKISVNALRQLPASAIAQINQAIGFRLLTKFGQQGSINLSKSVPIIAGVVGGTFDALTTRAIGHVAISVFKSNSEQPEELK